MAVRPPNFTQIPNEILDKMDQMTPAEFKVLIAICRKTFGWQKARDVISLSQLEEITGLSRTAVHAGITAAIKRGMLERVKVGQQSYSYHLLVASDYQSTDTTSSLNGTEPVASDYQLPVASDYSQKKGLKKEIKEAAEEDRARADDPPLAATASGSRNVEVEARLEALGLYPSQVKADIAAAVGSRQGFTLDDVAVCEAYVERELPTFTKAVATLHNQYLRHGKLPPVPSPARQQRAPTARTGPPPGEPPGVTASEAKALGAARKAEALKGLPANI